jgi:hypothetical protein
LRELWLEILLMACLGLDSEKGLLTSRGRGVKVDLAHVVSAGSRAAIHGWAWSHLTCELHKSTKPKKMGLLSCACGNRGQDRWTADRRALEKGQVLEGWASQAMSSMEGSGICCLLCAIIPRQDIHTVSCSGYKHQGIGPVSHLWATKLGDSDGFTGASVSQAFFFSFFILSLP